MDAPIRSWNRGALCKIDDCEGLIKARGLCDTHYKRDLRGEKVDRPLRRHPRWAEHECQSSACNRSAKVQGFCQAHWARKRQGLPTDIKLQLTRGMTMSERMAYYTDAPDDNGCRLWNGGINRDGYPIVSPTGGGGSQMAHRVALGLHTGEPIPKGLVVHHKCSVKACVEPSHLQAITPHENTAEMMERGELNRRIQELELALSLASPDHALVSVEA